MTNLYELMTSEYIWAVSIFLRTKAEIVWLLKDDQQTWVTSLRHKRAVFLQKSARRGQYRARPSAYKETSSAMLAPGEKLELSF